MNGTLRYGAHLIPYQVKIRANQSTRVLIKVHPDGEVVVHAPHDALPSSIDAAVSKRARWIYLQLESFAQNHAHVIPRQYISGESHFYMGRRYQLKVYEDAETKPQTKLVGAHIAIYTQNSESEKVRTLLFDWYKIRAKEVFKRRLQALLSRTLWVSDEPPIRIQSMQTQWGSCTPSGSLTLNPHLVKAPKECIDYVILHELCHLAEHNHSKRFWRLLSQVMPDWEKAKTRLDHMAELYLNDVKSPYE